MHHNRQRVESCVHSRCRGHRHARAGLRGWNKPKRARKARADAQPEAAPPSTHSLSHHPGIMQNPDASYSQGHTRAGLQERNKQKRLTRKARAHAQPRASPASTHPARPSPSSRHHCKPGIPAQQMQRTDTRERACGIGTGQNPLAEHAHHATQPRSIACGEAEERQR